jgi:hypothetical protein
VASKVTDPTPGETLERFSGVTGRSQGIVSAVTICPTSPRVTFRYCFPLIVTMYHPSMYLILRAEITMSVVVRLSPIRPLPLVPKGRIGIILAKKRTSSPRAPAGSTTTQHTMCRRGGSCLPCFRPRECIRAIPRLQIFAQTSRIAGAYERRHQHNGPHINLRRQRSHQESEGFQQEHPHLQEI